MSRSNSSHSETHHLVRALVLTVLLFSGPYSAAAGKCENLFRPNLLSRVLNLVPRSAKFVLSETQKRELQELLTETQYRKPHGMGRDEKDPLFIYMWNHLPATKQRVLVEVFESAPPQFRKFRMSISETLERNGIKNIPGNSFVDVMLNGWGNYLSHLEGKSEPPMSFERWLSELQNKAKDANPEELARRHEAGLQAALADDAWKSAGARRLEMKESEVLVGNQWLKCKVNAAAQTIRILVPRELVRHAAWNPLSTQVLIQKIQSGASPLAFFPGFIGADALFYLSDGNHRFAVDTRPAVWIELSYPARSSSYAITFDAMGIPQPSVEQKLQLNQGDISLIDIVGPVLIQKFFYR